MADVIESANIGKGVIDGIECDHLAFRNIDTDWQIWIEAGARPIPRKYVITSKAVAGAPQYTLGSGALLAAGVMVGAFAAGPEQRHATRAEPDLR